MKCSKCGKDTITEVLLEYKIHKCFCGFRDITDFDDKPIDQFRKNELEDIWNG